MAEQLHEILINRKQTQHIFLSTFNQVIQIVQCGFCSLFDRIDYSFIGIDLLFNQGDDDLFSFPINDADIFQFKHLEQTVQLMNVNAACIDLFAILKILTKGIQILFN